MSFKFTKCNNPRKTPMLTAPVFFSYANNYPFTGGKTPPLIVLFLVLSDTFRIDDILHREHRCTKHTKIFNTSDYINRMIKGFKWLPFR